MARAAGVSRFAAVLVASILVAFCWLLPGAPAFAQGPPGDAPPLELAFEETAVVVSGLEEGEEVALVGGARVPLGYGFLLERWAGRLVADGLGEARFEVELPEGVELPGGGTVPVGSTWAAVSLGDGRVALAAPAEREVARLEVDERRLPSGAGGAVRRLVQDGEEVVVFLVRPGEGAWWLEVLDGSDRDGDGEENARLEVLFEALEVVGSGEAGGFEPFPESPGQLRGRDVVVVIDPETLAAGATERPGPPEDPGDGEEGDGEGSP